MAFSSADMPLARDWRNELTICKQHSGREGGASEAQLSLLILATHHKRHDRRGKREYKDHVKPAMEESKLDLTNGA